MAAAALIVVLVGIQSIVINSRSSFLGLLLLVLAAVLLAIHPRFLNLAIRFANRLKLKSANSNATSLGAFHVKRYPWRPLLGELGFIALRSAGFVLTFLTLNSIATNQIPLLVTAFSLAWLLGLVVPIAPGGLGVFEVTAISLLEHSFSPAAVISAIALYRVVSILAEAGGDGLACLDEKLGAINNNHL